MGNKKTWTPPRMVPLEEGIGADGDNDEQHLKRRCRGNRTRFRQHKENRCRRRKGTKFS